MRNGKLALVVCLFLGATAFGMAGTGTTTAPPWCRPTDDMLAQRFLAQLLDLATSNDSDWVAARRTLKHMPQVDSSSVWLVNEDSLCQRASAALDSSLYTTPHGYPLYLAHVGPRYIAFPPSDSTTGYGVWVHLDSTFKVLMWSRNQ